MHDVAADKLCKLALTTVITTTKGVTDNATNESIHIHTISVHLALVNDHSYSLDVQDQISENQTARHSIKRLAYALLDTV